MTTDNRTNGQIVAKALVAHCEDHKMPVPRGSVKKIVEALRAAGRLAGEPWFDHFPAERDASTEQLGGELAACLELRAYWRSKAIEARAERDAAVAAIERVRAAVSGHPECDRYEDGDVISCGWKSAYASVVAALDGAPEPEWEYGLGNRKSPRDAGIPYPDEAHVRWLASALEETPTFGPQLMHRRKAGPWLPVEGESK